jgi:hypothetical protein
MTKDILIDLRTEILDQIAELIREEADDAASAAEHLVPVDYADTFVARNARALDLIAVIGRSDAILEDFARVADQVLAWDACSFVNMCGVACDDVRAHDLTPRDYKRLARLNGGKLFTYNLNNWST